MMSTRMISLAAALGTFALPSFATTNSDLSYVEAGLLTALSTTASQPYGTVSAASISPCISASCQSTDVASGQASASSAASQGGIASAKADASLSAGTLGAYAQELGTTGSSAASGAALWDTLTFSGAASGAQGVITLTVQGKFSDVGSGAAAVAAGSSFLTLSSPSSWTTLNTTTPSTTISVPFTIVNGTPIQVGAAVIAKAYNSFNIATGDLYDPPTLSLTLPTGVSYTSASGDFLTAAVPEPQVTAMFLAAAGLLGFRLRRNTQA